MELLIGIVVVFVGVPVVQVILENHLENKIARTVSAMKNKNKIKA